MASGEWQTNDLSQYGLAFGGVSNIFSDSQGKLWVSTPGNGLLVWDGEAWKNFRTSNSDIPQNSVDLVIETAPDVYWAGFAFSMQPGGQLARYDGKQWQLYSSDNSGFSGDEPSALAIDSAQRLWIGTRVNGLQVFSTNHP